MKKVWLKAAQNMQILSRDSIELNSRLHAGLEAQDASLKHAIFDELQEYEENIQAIKET